MIFMLKRISFFLIKLFVISTISFASGLDTLWTKSYGGTGLDIGYSVTPTFDKGFLFVGWTTSLNGGGIYVVKTDSLGDTMWTRVHCGASSMGKSVLQTSDSGFIITGTIRKDSTVDDIVILRLSPKGDTLWTKSYGGFNIEAGECIQEIPGKGYIISGWIGSIGQGSLDVFLVKTDYKGDSLWLRTYGGEQADFGYSMDQTADGGFIITGTTKSFGDGSWDFYILRTDSIGDTLWAKIYGGSGDDIALDVKTLPDKGYLFSGVGDDNKAFVIRTDSLGDTIWARNYGNSGEAKSALVLKDEELIVAGIKNFGAAGNAYILKIKSNGDTLWTKTVGGGRLDYAEEIKQIDNNNFIVIGCTESIGTGDGDFYAVRLRAAVSVV